MLLSCLLLLAGLVLILIAAEGFTNGVEAFGRRFALSQAVVGSLLAAVGTAMPETILPIVAILFYGGANAHHIGVGAILGAPFMLATLAFFLIGLTVLITWLLKRRRFEFNTEIGTTRRDLSFFLAMYSLSIFGPLLLGHGAVKPIAIALVLGYGFYVYRTMKCESAELEEGKNLHIHTLLERSGFHIDNPNRLAPIVAQILISLAVMVAGAQVFVRYLEIVSVHFGLDPLLFALFLAPVATELPEKFNSVSWTLAKKDSLALGNITGAMVFQATVPVSIGMLFTEWKLGFGALLSAGFALTSALVMLVGIASKKKVSPLALLCGGLLYAAYVIIIIMH